ncbi:Uridine phosphorylase 1 [Armadillidium nasatum]|uniref:Uridine phosphorylase 1 n=1 Tax=Armadillidium nasatum TaxID=96803 RepID=A0A5N5SRC1_9CRUS|nr:Uridine phosphorylase 1 [Armadillidium nasatum]
MVFKKNLPKYYCVAKINKNRLTECINIRVYVAKISFSIDICTNKYVLSGLAKIELIVSQFIKCRNRFYTGGFKVFLSFVKTVFEILITITMPCQEITMVCQSNGKEDDKFEEETYKYQKIFNEVKRETRFPDGAVRLRNPHIAEMPQDILYHLALGSGSHDLQEMFGDVKIRVHGRHPKKNGRVGPVLCLSHGMGIPSVGILLHEVIKLMYHAGCKDPVFFRLGTCGVLGELQKRPALLDKTIVDELKTLRMRDDPFNIISGKTMCTYDFYEGAVRRWHFVTIQRRTRWHSYTKFMKKVLSTWKWNHFVLQALCHHAGIRSAVICVTILNRLKGDQVSTPKKTLNEWQEYPQIIVARYIKETHGSPNRKTTKDILPGN